MTPSGALAVRFRDGACSMDEINPPEIPDDVANHESFRKIDEASYDRVNDLIRERTYITAREWAIARLCADFRTETGVEMTKIGKHLPELVPFMEDTYSPQAVNEARKAFDDKVRKSAATFLYGGLSGFYTNEELEDVLHYGTEVSRFLLEVEGADVEPGHEVEVEESLRETMQQVRREAAGLRSEHEECPHCGGDLSG